MRKLYILVSLILLCSLVSSQAPISPIEKKIDEANIKLNVIINQTSEWEKVIKENPSLLKNLFEENFSRIVIACASTIILMQIVTVLLQGRKRRKLWEKLRKKNQKAKGEVRSLYEQQLQELKILNTTINAANEGLIGLTKTVNQLEKAVGEKEIVAKPIPLPQPKKKHGFLSIFRRKKRTQATEITPETDKKTTKRRFLPRFGIPKPSFRWFKRGKKDKKPSIEVPIEKNSVEEMVKDIVGVDAKETEPKLPKEKLMLDQKPAPEEKPTEFPPIINKIKGGKLPNDAQEGERFAYIIEIGINKPSIRFMEKGEGKIWKAIPSKGYREMKEYQELSESLAKEGENHG